MLSAVDPAHLGAALQSPDLTAVWGFRTLLGRGFPSAHEYVHTHTHPSTQVHIRRASGRT